MKSVLPLVIAGLFATDLSAQSAPAAEGEPLFLSMDEVDLSQFKWKKRPVVVFAESELDPAFVTQMELLRARPEELLERDVVVITDTQPEPLSDLRRKLRVPMSQACSTLKWDAPRSVGQCGARVIAWIIASRAGSHSAT